MRDISNPSLLIPGQAVAEQADRVANRIEQRCATSDDNGSAQHAARDPEHHRREAQEISVAMSLLRDSLALTQPPVTPRPPRLSRVNKSAIDGLLDRADTASRESRRLRAERRTLAAEASPLIWESRRLSAEHQILVAEARRLRRRPAGLAEAGVVIALRPRAASPPSDGGAQKLEIVERPAAPQPLFVERSALRLSR